MTMAQQRRSPEVVGELFRHPDRKLGTRRAPTRSTVKETHEYRYGGELRRADGRQAVAHR